MFSGMASAPTPSNDDKRQQTSIEELRNEIIMHRKIFANQLVDLFESLEQMNETEFLEVISTLDGNGLIIGAMLEKFRKFKKS